MNAKDMKNMAAKAVLAAVMSLSLGAYAGSSWVTWYVAPDGDDANDGLSWATAMKSPELVPAKMIAADAGQTYVQKHELIISNGYYRLSNAVWLNEADGYKLGAIKIRSFTGNPADVTLDGQGQCQGVCIKGGWDGVISGLTVTNCVSASWHGGGISLHSGTKGRVSDCIVRDCHVAVGDTAYNGGGIYGHSGTISGCTVEGCSITNVPSAAGKTCNGGGIYGYRCMVTNCIVRNCAIKMNAGECYPMGAGVWVGETSGSKYDPDYPLLGVFETEISCCTIETPRVDAGRGTGLTVTCKIPDGEDGTKYQATVKDCFVHDCTNHLDAAVYLIQHVDAINVTSSNNYDAASSARTDNSTGLHLGPRCHATGCLIASNVGNTGDNNNYGSPAIYMEGGDDGCSLIDSAVIGNESPAKVAIWFKTGTTSKMTVSNCVFSANHQTAAHYGGLLWVPELGEGGEVEIVDSYFTDNDTSSCTWGGWVRVSTSTAGRQWAVRFRNCQCTGNKFGKIGAASAHTASAAQHNSNIELSFENCTIADNTLASGYVIHGYSDKINSWTHVASSNVHIKACVVVNNTGGSSTQIGRLIYEDTTNLNYSVFAQDSSLTLNPGMVGNRFYDSTRPLFVDAANGDYRLASGSQAIDIAPRQPWMGNGTRNGPQDLGSGYKVQKSGKYGVTIMRENSSRRFSGSLADAGCCEYFFVPGFSLIVR